MKEIERNIGMLKEKLEGGYPYSKSLSEKLFPENTPLEILKPIYDVLNFAVVTSKIRVTNYLNNHIFRDKNKESIIEKSTSDKFEKYIENFKGNLNFYPESSSICRSNRIDIYPSNFDAQKGLHILKFDFDWRRRIEEYANKCMNYNVVNVKLFLVLSKVS